MVEPGETSGARCWRLVSGQSLRAHQWDGEFVVYNDLSGDTHLIDTAAMDVLLALQAAPAGLAFAGGAEGALDELLATLETAALIECAAC